MSTLNIMVGVPGAGKSYWLKQNAKPAQVVSRDEIRFSLLKEGDEYFDNEKEVFRTFIQEIQKRLDYCDAIEVYADATHLTAVSRYKLLSNLNLDNVDVNIIYIKSSQGRCLANNSQREGIRCIPEQALISAYQRLVEPSFDEYDYKSIITVEYNDR